MILIIILIQKSKHKNTIIFTCIEGFKITLTVFLLRFKKFVGGEIQKL